MNVTTSIGPHECARAERHKDGVHLFDENGELIIILASPEDIRSVEGGEIVVVDKPEPTQNERVEALEAAITMLCMPDMEV
jgi:hypothetical protein